MQTNQPNGQVLLHRRVSFGATFSLTCTAPVQTFLRLRPAASDRISDRLVVDDGSSPAFWSTAIDRCAAGATSPQFVDLVALREGVTQVRYSGEMSINANPDPMPSDAAAPNAEELTPEGWWWLQPTRYCRPDELGPEAWALFGSGVSRDRPATGADVRKICAYVNQEMTFEYGSSTPLTSATDAWSARRGVCRDYNHIAVSFCRALNIPTRYAFGYLPDIDVAPSDATMDFCAWFEVFLDGSWWTFDARVNEPRIGRIVIARGRDAADVPMVSTLGPVVLADFEVTAKEVTPGTFEEPQHEF